MANIAMFSEYRSYERSYQAVKGEPIRVRPVPDGSDALGYTAQGEAIYVAYSHELMDSLKPEECRFFRSGVFTHEMMHQVFTSFDTHKRLLNSLKSNAQKQILATIMNVVEDPAIEYWAPTVVGGKLAESLKFTIAYIYKQTPPIDKSADAFGQYINALIQFGDMGVVKGSFTFPEAKKVFLETAPMFADAIKEPSGQKRLEIAYEIFDKSRELWEESVKNAEQLQKLIDDLLKQGKRAMSGTGEGQDGDETYRPAESKKDKRRKVTIKKVTKEELDELRKNGSVSSAPPPDDADITLLVCDEDDKNNSEQSESGCSISMDGEKSSDNNSDEKSDDKNEAKGDGSKNDDDVSKSDDNQNADSKTSEPNKNGEDSDSANPPQKNSQQADSHNNPFRAQQGGDPDTLDTNPTDECSEDDDCAIDESEYTLSEEDMEHISKEMEADIQKYEAELAADKKSDYTPEDFSISSPKLSRRSCLNYKVNAEEHDVPALNAAYNAITSVYSNSIHTCTNQIQKIIMNAHEEKEHRTSGRVNPYRLNSGRVTSRVFDKRTIPSNKSNCSFMLVIDESGSMYGEKIKAARECAISLAEIFGALGIDLYVMGFTADTQGYGIVHNHYITWKNKPVDRLKLLNISARANNCDGYSIRYATEVLKKKHSEHKVMIVLSDGQPAASNYSQGVSDTKDAIREAKKFASVLGVAIGNDDTNVIYSMYENDFVHISKTSDLFLVLSNKIKKMVKDWN